MKGIIARKWAILISYSLPIIPMIALISLIADDYLLAIIYAGCIVALYRYMHEPHDVLALAFGFVGITIAEYLFVMTGVETFTRQTLLGVMPIWLPFLWAYAFLTIKRSLEVIGR